MSDSLSTYITQKNADDYRSQCGPIALYNWLHFNQIKISLSYLINKCKAHMIYGTRIKPMDASISTINAVFDTHLQQRPSNECTLNQIKVLLENHTPVIILYHWTDGANSGNHYALIDAIYNDYGQYKFRIINHSFETPIKIVCAREIKSMLLPHTDKHFTTPVLWY